MIYQQLSLLLKKYVDVDGKFVDNNIKDLTFQSQIIINYFSAIKYHGG